MALSSSNEVQMVDVLKEGPVNYSIHHTHVREPLGVHGILMCTQMTGMSVACLPVCCLFSGVCLLDSARGAVIHVWRQQLYLKALHAASAAGARLVKPSHGGCAKEPCTVVHSRDCCFIGQRIATLWRSLAHRAWLPCAFVC